MSCRETPGGSVALTLARLGDGEATDADAQRAFHAVRRERATTPDPHPEDVRYWVRTQRHLLGRLAVSDSQRASIVARLDAVDANPEIYDGPTFEAMTCVGFEIARRRRIGTVDSTGRFGGAAPPAPVTWDDVEAETDFSISHADMVGADGSTRWGGNDPEVVHWVLAATADDPYGETGELYADDVTYSGPHLIPVDSLWANPIESDNPRVVDARNGYQAGSDVPPIVVASRDAGDGGKVVADGNHRVAAARLLGSTHVVGYVARLPGGPTSPWEDWDT